MKYVYLTTRELADLCKVSTKRIRTAAIRYMMDWNDDKEFQRSVGETYEYRMTPEFIFFLSSRLGEDHEDSAYTSYTLLAEIFCECNNL